MIGATSIVTLPAVPSPSTVTPTLADVPTPSEGTRPVYPPPRHVMTLLALESEIDASGDVRGWMPVVDHLLGADGMPRIGAVAMLVDALGGMRSITASDPDWAFTADMSLHLVPAGSMTTLQADLHVRRRGRRTLVIEAELLADGTRRAGSAVLTFAVVPRPQHLVDIRIDMTTGRRRMSAAIDAAVLDGDYIGEIAPVTLAPGSLELELRPQVANTVGALHGAVHASLIDEASVSLGRELLGGDCVTTDFHLAYLELGRISPVQVVATPVGGPGDDRLTCRVEVRDGDGAMSSVATTEVRLA